MNETVAKGGDGQGQDAKKGIQITVNGRPVILPKEDVNGRQIKEAAIQQGVPIQLDFVLQEELPNGHTKIIGDGDEIKVHPHDKFTAIAHDDNS